VPQWHEKEMGALAAEGRFFQIDPQPKNSIEAAFSQGRCFRGCGKTPLKRFCNKGTAPKVAEKLH
jgi:hypothetical protein